MSFVWGRNNDIWWTLLFGVDIIRFKRLPLLWRTLIFSFSACSGRGWGSSRGGIREVGKNGSDWSEIDNDKQSRTMKQIHHGSSWGGFILRSSGGVCVRTFKCRITTCPTHKVKVYHWLAHVVLTPLLSAAEMHFHHLSEINVYI